MDNEIARHGGIIEEDEYVNQKKGKYNWRRDFEFSDSDLDPNWEE